MSSRRGGRRGIGRDFDRSLWPGGRAFEFSCCPGGRDIWIFVRARDHKSFLGVGKLVVIELTFLPGGREFDNNLSENDKIPLYAPPPRQLDIDRCIIRNNRNDCFCPERWIICCLGTQRLCLHVLTSVNTIVLDIVYAKPCSSTQVLTSIYLPCIPPQSIQTIAPGLGWGRHFLTFTVFLESKGLLCKSRKYSNSPHIRTWIFQFSLNRFLYKWQV